MTGLPITFLNRAVVFSPWTPNSGVRFTSAIAIDTETTLIDDTRRWQTPNFVLAAATDGRQGVFITREHLSAFLRDHFACEWIFHNASFDLAVIHMVAPQLDVYHHVELGLVKDTQLEHQLLMLAVEGHTADGKGQATLDACAQRYLGVTLQKEAADQAGNQVRLNFGQFLGRPPQEIPREYLEYLGQDVLATLAVHQQIIVQTDEVLFDARSVWGFVDDAWIVRCRESWGRLTHDIQLRAAIVLREVTAAGLYINQSDQQALTEKLEAKMAVLRERLRLQGFLVGEKGSQKVLQQILQRIERRHGIYTVPRTPSRKEIQTSAEALEPLASVDPFVRGFIDYKTVEKLANSFAQKLERPRLHPSFRTIVRTGRTSSFGEINSQNLPRDADIRRCFTPSLGHVFVNADYSTIELATLASAVERQFGFESAMKKSINAGDDLHTLIAARVFGKEPEEVSKDDRQKAKAINFGKPGGMGNRTLQRHAHLSYGIKLTDGEAAILSEGWLEQFPEMGRFLRNDDNDRELKCLVKELQLNWADYNAAQDRSLRIRPSAQTSSWEQVRPLALMLRKTISGANPCKQKGGAYSDEERSYFWDRLAPHADKFAKPWAAAIRNREPSVDLRKQVWRFFDRGPVFTITGRLRANATFTARHNAIFQGLAADGAKLAMWTLWRAGYRIVNFIHDEFLIEVPASSNLAQHTAIVERLMIEGMKEVIRDMDVRVESVVTSYWLKAAKSVWDAGGKVTPWQEAAAT